MVDLTDYSHYRRWYVLILWVLKYPHEENVWLKFAKGLWCWRRGLLRCCSWGVVMVSYLALSQVSPSSADLELKNCAVSTFATFCHILPHFTALCKAQLDPNPSLGPLCADIPRIAMTPVISAISNFRQWATQKPPTAVNSQGAAAQRSLVFPIGFAVQRELSRPLPEKTSSCSDSASHTFLYVSSAVFTSHLKSLVPFHKVLLLRQKETPSFFDWKTFFLLVPFIPSVTLAVGQVWLAQRCCIAL